MSKVVYIIPGYDANLNLNNIKLVKRIFRKKKIKPIAIKIKWKFRSIDDYLSDLFSQISYKYDETYLFGFSYGAMIAMLAASSLHPKKMYLCSLSPSFKEDITAITKKSERRAIGKRRLKDFRAISFRSVAQSIKCPAFLFVGDRELNVVIKRSLQAKRTIKKSKLYIIPGAIHNLHHEAYIHKLQEIV